MSDQSISLRYMRTVQQLEKKKEEVDQLLKDAQTLDMENQHLRKSNEELTKRLEAAKLNEKQRENEILLLESHVKKLQEKLQQYIDSEVNNQRNQLLVASPKPASVSSVTAINSQPVSKRKPSQSTPNITVMKHNEIVNEYKAELAAKEQTINELHGRLLESEKKCVELSKDLEAAKNVAANAELEMKNAQIALNDLKKNLEIKEISLQESLTREAQYKSALKHINQRHAAAAQETLEMEEIENKALEGLRSEIMVLEADNERLRAALQEERQMYRDARIEFEKVNQLLVQQKEIYDAHQKINAEEIQALTLQTESMLSDLKLTVDRDGLRRQLDELKALQLSNAQAAKEHYQLALRSPKEKKRESFQYKPVMENKGINTIDNCKNSATSPISPLPPHAEFNSKHSRAMEIDQQANYDVHIKTLQREIDNLLDRNKEIQLERDQLLRQQSILQAESLTLERHNEELRHEVEEIRKQLSNLKKIQNEKNETEQLRKEKERVQEEEIQRLHNDVIMAKQKAKRQLPITKDIVETSSAIMNKQIERFSGEVQKIKEFLSKLQALSLSSFHLLETLVSADVISGITENEMLDIITPSFTFKFVKETFEKAVDLCRVIIHIKYLAKAIVQSRQITERAEEFATTSLPNESHSKQIVTTAKTVPTESLDISDVSQLTKYYRFKDLKGKSLKEVVDEYRSTSPRSHRSLSIGVDSTLVNLLDPLSVTKWEARRKSLLKDFSSTVRM